MAGSPTPQVPQSITALEPAVPREQVEVGEVAVEPRRWPVMVGGGDGPLPDRGERVLVEAVIELGDARSHRLVAQPDRTAPVVPRPVGGVDGSQGQHEVSQVERGLHGVVELVERRHGAGEPLHDAPRVGEGLVRLARRDRHRHGQRELRGDDGQPGLLLGHGVHRPVDAREPHGEVVAEPVERVVRARRRHPLDGQVRPLRVLAREQARARALRPCRPRRRASSAGPRGATQPDRPRTAERIFRFCGRSAPHPGCQRPQNGLGRSLTAGMPCERLGVAPSCA